MRTYVRNRCRLRYWGVQDWLEYAEPPALWIMLPLLAMSAYVLSLVPFGLAAIMLGGAILLGLAAVAAIPLWITTLAVWEGALDWLWTWSRRRCRQWLSERRRAALSGPLIIRQAAPQSLSAPTP